MDYILIPNLSPEDQTKTHDKDLIDNIKITNGTLCYKNQTIGHVHVLNYKNGTHGYGLSTSNKALQALFEKEARLRYPDFDNYSIQFMDVIFRMADLELKDKLRQQLSRN